LKKDEKSSSLSKMEHEPILGDKKEVPKGKETVL
jgi:hypothetical protein